MSFDQPIGAPFTLASLSKPISSTNGRVHAAGVCSASGAKKRKRTEIAVGIDGEGVSIYSLQNPQLVTSYALPPSATFTTAPYSIYRKGPPKTPTHRFTYVSLVGSSPAEKPQLVCFHEKTSGDQTETTKTSYTPSGPAHIVTLESLPVAPGGSAKENTHDVIVTFDTGDVACLSDDLGVVRWVANLKSLIAPGRTDVEIEHTTLASARSVTRGLLRNRQDIASTLDPTPDASSDLLDLVQVLCAVGRDSGGARMLTLLQVQPRSADLPTAQLTPLKQLLSWDLPSPVKSSSGKASPTQIALHPSSGALHILTKGQMLSYDLSGTVPKLYSEFVLPGSSVDSFLRTSQDVVFVTSQNICQVFDVKYNSLQGLYSFSSDVSTESTSPSKKRKHAQSDTHEHKTAPCSLVAYYADIGLVVAAREAEIFGMQFGGAAPRKRVKTEGTLLIDALGKGVASEAKVFEGQKWQERKGKLNKYAEKGKIAKFEEHFASELNIELESADVAQKHENEINGGPLTNGGGPSLPDEDAMVVNELDDEPAKDDLPRWKIPTTIPGNQRQLYRQYALYALSKIFYLPDASEQEESQGHLKVGFFPPNVFQWLLQTGQLTKESIRRALLDESHSQIQSVSEIVDGDIVKALVDYDSDLHILSAVLNHSQFLPIGEVVQAIKLLIQSIDDVPREEEEMKLLTNGTAPSEDEMDLDFATELEAASHEIDHALSVLDHGLLTRSHTLRPALIRLHTFSAPMISSTLRSVLPRRDLESLIRLLHLELKNGGWSSPLGFVDPESSGIESEGEDPDDHAVSIIASLLSSTLDAIGAGAWLASVSTLSASESGEDMLKSLNRDASIALSGFFEAHFIRGLLSEFLRYASTVPAPKKPSNKQLELQGKPFSVTGKLNGEEDLPMLPLGAKAEQGVEKMKNGKGGKKEQRSKREMGMLISKRVPKYSFERIVV
ncbi:hypothetical protein PtrSN002B_010311 [Pyrenophora tritici-repentis]|uniref:Utp8 beta-propeller domain-containing protein n=2 Tax=Pyrenophora tritici-repentis TaxID=45151 RepID=A0A2W1H0X7_9PLEO|nr:uncharacterized protein PTRG_05883 [Pyrenophora tritici-repentis Pt-1C-BFP]KAA8618892.1 hypothetical protein PtrV1_08321 [Pyrenophora tritici-repentis]EDU48803.1 conserved hypothetical protein [Pyrenophora tritici-repentis Pt-1C-BFP]KAF7449454.1 hypothetical protein A1F99_065030 [Pyrenophora tritici-repentis]KAF7570440.1 hypothetical protein PtrM4_104420 [Pyrenophora tritici-repentis]KAG9383698.1 hypothetical protein A1F94_005609 [Pyrenophora tritici-repentis]